MSAPITCGNTTHNRDGCWDLCSCRKTPNGHTRHECGACQTEWKNHPPSHIDRGHIVMDNEKTLDNSTKPGDRVERGRQVLETPNGH